MKQYKFFGSEVAFAKPINKDFKYIKNPRHLYDLLSNIWCEQSCAPRMRSEWSKENKTLGQCSITAFLVQDIFGGEVYGVPLKDGAFHCYNKIGDVRFDLTSEQFGDEVLVYDDAHPQSREEHFKSEEKYQRYLYLKEQLQAKHKTVKAKRIVSKTFMIAGLVVASIVVTAAGYVGYVLLSYNRIGNIDLKVERKSSLTVVNTGEQYSIYTHNFGFGAYSQDYTFFMDDGYDENGNTRIGHWSTARSKADVLFNTDGAVETATAAKADFYCFQEVDTNSTRSYHVNQDKKIDETFTTYDHVHAVNFHTAFLPYPLYDMHGTVNAGLTTMSKYQVQSAQRKQYTVSDSFSKYFDLDRCFSVCEIDVNNGKKLYICNSHMSAYDEGGTVRNQQVKELNDFLKSVKDAGNYVVIGGDWNHDLLRYNPDFSYTDENRPFAVTLRDPDWLVEFFDKEGKSPLMDGFKVVASDNVPTCRNNDIEWEPGKTYVCCIDGFIVSDNVKINNHYNIQTKNGKKGLDGFAFSDHDPTYMEFELL